MGLVIILYQNTSKINKCQCIVFNFGKMSTHGCKYDDLHLCDLFQFLNVCKYQLIFPQNTKPIHITNSGNTANVDWNKTLQIKTITTI